MKTGLNLDIVINSLVLKQPYFYRFFILFIVVGGFFTPLQAQQIKAGDVVYFRMRKVQERRYFTTPVYVIATVKSVIGSSAILDTEMYLYKCRFNDTYFKMGTTLEIAKPFGVGHLYDTWRASQNKGYRWSLAELKRYNSSVEKEITKGKIQNNTKRCMVLTN